LIYRYNKASGGVHNVKDAYLFVQLIQPTFLVEGFHMGGGGGRRIYTP
jgi:hypothetical protein